VSVANSTCRASAYQSINQSIILFAQLNLTIYEQKFAAITFTWARRARNKC